MAKVCRRTTWATAIAATLATVKPDVQTITQKVSGGRTPVPLLLSPGQVVAPAVEAVEVVDEGIVVVAVVAPHKLRYCAP